MKGRRLWTSGKMTVGGSVPAEAAFCSHPLPGLCLFLVDQHLLILFAAWHWLVWSLRRLDRCPHRLDNFPSS
jgi:hypothetical protein